MYGGSAYRTTQPTTAAAPTTETPPDPAPACCGTRVAPKLSVHLLTNGRRFGDPEFTRRYAAVGLADIMAGVPVYAPEPGLHDFIVQAVGAFDETIHGILNLASLGQAVEIRVVVQRRTVPVLPGLATFIARNLPFVAQVALMGLEMTGLARPNSSLVWADPADGRTTTLTSAAPARSATHAAASSRPAATALASTFAQCPDRRDLTEGTEELPQARRYRITAMDVQAMVRAADQMRATARSWVPPVRAERTALTIGVTGWYLAKGCSQPGIEEAGT
jgi:hypothetical protein